MERVLGLRLVVKMFHAVGFGDYSQARVGDRKTATAVQVVVVADLDAGGNVDALVDDRPANFGVSPDVHPFKQNGIDHLGVAVDAGIGPDDLPFDLTA